MSTSREYEIVVFGASGYTGKLTAEYIAAKLQTNLRWAIAGRSQAKLESIAAELKASNPDRIQPGKLGIQSQFHSTVMILSTFMHFVPRLPRVKLPCQVSISSRKILEADMLQRSRYAASTTLKWVFLRRKPPF
jgi:hypothetical protein